MLLKVTVNGIEYDVEVEVAEEPLPTLGSVTLGTGSSYAVTPGAAKAPGTPANGLSAPIAGTVVNVLVDEGQAVKSGETVIVLEAMKMETEITAPQDGTIAAVLVTVGEAVLGGQVLLEWADDAE